MDRIPMTPAGYDKLQKELTHLKSVVRPQNIKDLEEARAHGDLSENAEYSAAKEKQSLIAGQISMIEDRLGRAEVIDPAKVPTKDRVVFGATVKLYDYNIEEDVYFQIVGDDESDIKEKKLGISAPIAKGLLGKKIGDEVRVQTPKGVREFEVLAIEYK